MKDCREIRPCLYRVAEGEASPDEAIETARHLSDCTGCRILFAREVRLAAMLERGLADRVPVGEDFVQSVMDALPAEPPARPRRRRANLKLASFGLLAGLASIGGIERAATGAGLTVPRPEGFDLGEPGAAEALAAAGRILAVATDAALNGLPAIATPDGVVGTVLAVGGSLSLAAVSAVALLAVATRSLLRV